MAASAARRGLKCMLNVIFRQTSVDDLLSFISTTKLK
jgi:hypothetical protein